MSSQSLTLYKIEEHLAALIDTVDLVDEKQEQEFAAEFEASLKSAVDKRDNVGRFLAHLDSQINLASAEVKRLQERKAALARVAERVEGYVQRTIESFGMDNEGRYRKLEGNTVTFSLRACPPSVLITDADAIPQEFKTLSIKMPAELWDEIAEGMEPALISKVQLAVDLADISIEKKAIKTAIDQGWDVPGADLAIGNHSLVTK